MPKKSIKRKMITVVEETFSASDFEGSLKNLKQKTDALIKKYGENAYLNYDKYYSYPYDPEYYPSYEVQISREENDNELEKRLEQEKESQEQIKKRELAELARLQEKYAGEKK